MKLNHKEKEAVAENVYCAIKKGNEVKHGIWTTKIKHGAKPTPLRTKQKVWDFWPESSQETSDKFWPAKLQCTNKPCVQSGLQFVSSVKIVTIQKRLL